jgi:hypothetical protein
MIRPTLLLGGAFTFAFLLAEMIHDCGHYLCHQTYGNIQVQVHFDPFGGTHIVGADHLPAEILAITSAAGPLSNLAFGVICFVVLWKQKRPILLPLLLLGPLAMIQEGVTFSLGLLTPGGDAQWISNLGFPQSGLLAIGMLLLTGGLVALTLLLPLAGIEPGNPARRRLLIVLFSICPLMLIRFAYSLLVNPESTVENLIPLVFSLLLCAIIVFAQLPLARVTGKIAFSERPPATWRASITALILGLGMVTVQFLAE